MTTLAFAANCQSDQQNSGSIPVTFGSASVALGSSSVAEAESLIPFQAWGLGHPIHDEVTEILRGDKRPPENAEQFFVEKTKQASPTLEPPPLPAGVDVWGEWLALAKGKPEAYGVEAWWWLWYTYLCVQVCREDELLHFNTLIEAANCPAYLDIMALCVKLFAGWDAESREKFLGALRGPFKARAGEVAKTRCEHCICGATPA